MNENNNIIPSNLKFEFENFITYESILCVFFPNSKIINSACIGVHFTPMKEAFMHVYDDTDTKDILTVGTRYTLNFSENFMEHTLAALAGWHKGSNEPEIPTSVFSQIEPYPILKSAWVTVYCEVIEMPPLLTTCRQRIHPNIRAKILEIKVHHLPKIFHNRSFNLAIEALVLTTRSPITEQFSKNYFDNLKIYKWIKEKIRDWGEWSDYSKSFEIMDSFLLKNNVKPMDLFEIPDHKR